MLALLSNPTPSPGNAEAADAAAAADPSGQTGWNAPVSDRNAYNGGTSVNGAGTEVTNAGLNPDAIVGVRLDNSDYNTTTWDLSVTTGATAGAGIKNPVLTGMVQKSQLETGITISLVSPEFDSVGGYTGFNDTMDTATIQYGDPGLTLNANAWSAAGPNDYVPFEINTLEMGRGLTQGVTGPTFAGVQDDGVTGYALVGYTLGNLTSPATQVNLPAYTPATPAITADSPTGAIQITLNGAFQATDSTSNSYEVKLYDTNSHLLYEDDLPTSGYAGTWNGLAWSYSLVVDLGHNSSGQIICPTGAVIPSPAEILQNFWESVLSNPLDSSTVGVQ